jgi:hypothetical protein
MNATYGLDPAQLLQYVIKPTLKGLFHKKFLGGPIPEVLILGTGMAESKLRYLDQIDKTNKPGPAYGIFQMEENTHADIWKNYLGVHPDLAASINTMRGGSFDINNLTCNLAYAVAMVRVHYLRVPQALPSLNARDLASYYKRFYNTILGDAKIEEASKYFDDAITVCKSTP